MSDKNLGQSWDSNGTGGVPRSVPPDNSRGTLKALAQKVLNSSVPPVPYLESGTVGQCPEKSGTSPGQLWDSNDLEASRKRLECADIRVAVFITETDAGLVIRGAQLVQGEQASRDAWSQGAVVFHATEMHAYIGLTPSERRLFRNLKRIGGKR